MSGEHFDQKHKCPECGQLVEQAFGAITDDKNDEIYEIIIGYDCKKCDLKWDINWEPVEKERSAK